LFLVILFTIFHGDGTLYYRHFFGFFSADSGWGALRTGDFQLLPSALVAAHWPMHLVAVVATGVGLAYPSPQVSRKIQLLGWLPLLSLLWLTSCAAYFLNRSGGGLWYFGAFYVLLAFHLARAVGWERIDFPWLRELVCAGLFCACPGGRLAAGGATHRFLRAGLCLPARHPGTRRRRADSQRGLLFLSGSLRGRGRRHG